MLTFAAGVDRLENSSRDCAELKVLHHFGDCRQGDAVEVCIAVIRRADAVRPGCGRPTGVRYARAPQKRLVAGLKQYPAN